MFIKPSLPLLITLLTLPLLSKANDLETRLSNLEKRVEALENQQKPSSKTAQKRKSIEAIDLLKLFALDKSVNYSAYSWTTGTNSPIEWLHGGIKEAEKLRNGDSLPYPYYREGKVIVTNHGKVTHTLLGKEIEKGYWRVRLTGARSGYTQVELSSDAVTYDDPAFEIAKKYILKSQECNDMATDHVSFALVKFEGKKPFWLRSETSGGSAGSSTGYTIMYDTKPQC